MNLPLATIVVSNCAISILVGSPSEDRLVGVFNIEWSDDFIISHIVEASSMAHFDGTVFPGKKLVYSQISLIEMKYVFQFLNGTLTSVNPFLTTVFLLFRYHKHLLVLINPTLDDINQFFEFFLIGSSLNSCSFKIQPSMALARQTTGGTSPRNIPAGILFFNST